MPNEIDPDVIPDTDPTPDVGDITVYAAKIAELEAELVTLRGELADKQIELDKQKAANYDLLMTVPSDAPNEEANGAGDDTDDEAPEIEDLFGEDDNDKNKD